MHLLAFLPAGAFIFVKGIKLPFRIKVPQEYDLLSSVHSWIFPDIQPVPEQTGAGFFGRAYDFDCQHVVLVIRQSGPGKSLQITHSNSDVKTKDLRAMVERTLNLGLELDGALKRMSEDPVIAHLVPKVAGVRPYMSPTPFEALIKTIIQQQVSYRAANIFTKRMILELTKPVVFEGSRWYYFPSAQTISNAGLDGLREFGFGYKAEYIHNVATLAAKGNLALDALIDASYEKALEWLKPIRGIGDWTVRVFSLAGLGNFTVFAYEDLVIQRILGKLYNQGRRMTAKQVQEHAESWGSSNTMVLYLLMCAEVLGYFE
jgi:DNA-3-methyladenine glycosylase II